MGASSDGKALKLAPGSARSMTACCSAALDDEDLLDNGNHRYVALLSNRRGGVYGLADCHTLDFYGLASNSFVDEVVMTYRVDMHANVSVDFPPLNRNFFHMQWNDLDRIGRRLDRHL